MLYNLNCTKRGQMITPDKLLPLPQDIYLEKGTPKSTKEDYEKFLEKVARAKAGGSKTVANFKNTNG
jgi:hypothetical protein